MALSPQQLRVAELVASGISPTQVSGATGFSASYISQLQGMPDFKEEVARLSSGRVAKELDTQDKYDDVENSLLGQIKGMIGHCEMPDLVRALDVVAKHNPKKSMLGDSNKMGEGGLAITINLPNHVLPDLQLKVNARNEVIEVGQQEMMPLTVSAIEHKVKSIGNR